MIKNLISKFNNKSAKIGVIGLGYVGLPLALCYSEAGFEVIGFDIDKIKVKKLNHGESYIENISCSRIKRSIKSSFKATNNFSDIKFVDAIIICVPTPLKKNQKPNLNFVIKTTNLIVPHLRKEQIISLESTTYPGTTEEVILPRIESNNLKVGRDIFLVYSPEREDPSNPHFHTVNIPKIIGGHTKNCLLIGKSLYGNVINKIIPVSSTKVAEMTKLLENIHRAVNIGLVNEIKIVADKMGINIYEVIKAASTKPFGFTPYFPGPGLGGHCIPIDPFYLTWKARQYGVDTDFIKLAGKVNSKMPNWVLKKTIKALAKEKKSLKKAKILVLGIAYKRNVDDTRESPGIEIIRLLKKKGSIVHYSDPHVPIFPEKRDYKFNLRSIDLTPKKIRSYDAILLITDHKKFDYKKIKYYGKLIVDTRGIYKKVSNNIVLAWLKINMTFLYHNIVI